ncbi:hypothetical protein N752_14760 [Desulforamulus aquiferis]|nr:hypothetical protein [Desulforamulus aquiferis]RYD04630.1 hypothetical protein N752_14760 [Desulforamulus aquiferis]
MKHGIMWQRRERRCFPSPVAMMRETTTVTNGLRGDLGCLDMGIMDGAIKYGCYPNALERITGCLDNPNAGDMIVTAEPGYILGGEGGAFKVKIGNHGSLHREDSLVPLIISGTPQGIERPRLVDVVPFVKSLLLTPQV